MVVAPQLGRLVGCLLTVQPASQPARRVEHNPEKPVTGQLSPLLINPLAAPLMMLRCDGLRVEVKIFDEMQMAPCVESCAEEGGIKGRQGLVAHLTAYYTSHLACPFERKIGGGGGGGGGVAKVVCTTPLLVLPLPLSPSL